VLLCLLLAPPCAAANLPPGFEETVLAIGSPLSSLNCIAIAPDGRIFIAAGFGWIWVLENGTLRNIAQLPVHYEGEDGISGMALDPDFLTNNHVWVTRAMPPSGQTLRVARFTYTGTALVGEVPMIEWPNASTWHNAGCLRFGADKTLYVSTGDDYLRSTTSQNPFDLRGKVLHVNRDGTPAAGNPYLDGVAGDPRVWAIGFRNPFRFSFQPHGQNMFIADVGDGDWEEVSIGIPGGNFGWANVEGPAPPGLPGYVYPIYWYDHSDPIGAAITGGDFADEGDFSEAFHGNYFFGDSSRSKLYRMQLDEDNHPVETEVWATDTPMPVDIQFGPDGSLYYASYIPASVRKITYIGGENQQPVAEAVAIPDSGPAPLATTLDGSASHDPDGDPLFFSWDLGDGTYSSQEVVAHQYPPGVYQAKLTIGDDMGGTDQAPPVRIVSGNRKPVAVIEAPLNGASFAAGQQVSYSGDGMDLEDGAVPCSKFSWTVTLHHLGHVHPYLGPIQGVCSGSFVTDERNETSTEIWYEVRLDVKDNGTPLGSAGVLAGSQSVNLYPVTAMVSLETTPLPNLMLVMDTQDFVAPRTFEGVVNFVRTIGVVEPQLMPNGHTYRWLHWSDDGAREHEIRFGVAQLGGIGEPQTITAHFGCDVIQEAGNLRLSKSPGDLVEFQWDPVVADPCLRLPVRYQIYASNTARPTTPPGNFPNDPGFALVTETSQTSFTYAPSESHRYFVVVAVGTDNRPGKSGHYRY